MSARLLLVWFVLHLPIGSAFGSPEWDALDSYSLVITNQTELRRGNGPLFTNGKTIIFRQTIEKPLLSLPYYLPLVFAYNGSNTIYTVGCMAGHVFSTNAMSIAFFGGTNVIKAYSVSDFIPKGQSFWPGTSPIVRHFDLVRSPPNTFAMETSAGEIWKFDITTGEILSRDLKFETLLYLPWFSLRSRAVRGRSAHLVVGSVFFTEGETKVVLTRANELFSRRATAAYVVELGGRAIQPPPRREEIFWFLTTPSGENVGSLLDGGPLGIEK